MKTSAHITSDQLDEYYMDRVSDQEREHCEAHFEQCEHCWNRYLDVVEFVGALKLAVNDELGLKREDPRLLSTIRQLLLRISG